jgi:hypothetical protein
MERPERVNGCTSREVAAMLRVEPTRFNVALIGAMLPLLGARQGRRRAWRLQIDDRGHLAGTWARKRRALLMARTARSAAERAGQRNFSFEQAT